MPLARITTPLPEYFERLAQDLRARGFDVETASPGQFFPATADLEITVKQCAPEDAAKVAASSNKDMLVMVAPGAKDSGIRSIEMILLQPRVESVETARHRVTPAQVIEISSALIGADAPAVQEAQPQVEAKPKHWPKVRTAAHSSWDEILRTTAQWLDTVNTACHAGWEKLKQSNVPLKAFLLEIGQETRSLGRSISSRMTRLARRTTNSQTDQNEPLVPSMFDFSEELGVEEEAPAVEKQKPHSVDRRFWRPGFAAAIVATVALVSVSVMRGPSQTPERAVESKSATPAVAKPTAMAEPEGSKNAVRMIAAKQVVRPEAEDTVVRYGNRPKASKPSPEHPGVRRYSDLD